MSRRKPTLKQQLRALDEEHQTVRRERCKLMAERGIVEMLFGRIQTALSPESANEMGEEFAQLCDAFDAQLESLAEAVVAFKYQAVSARAGEASMRLIDEELEDHRARVEHLREMRSYWATISSIEV